MTYLFGQPQEIIIPVQYPVSLTYLTGVHHGYYAGIVKAFFPDKRFFVFLSHYILTYRATGHAEYALFF